MLAQKSPHEEMILKTDMIIIISLHFYFILWIYNYDDKLLIAIVLGKCFIVLIYILLANYIG